MDNRSIEQNQHEGVKISKRVRWNGQDIFEIAFAAFEDSNFHTFNEKFKELWETEA